MLVQASDAVSLREQRVDRLSSTRKSTPVSAASKASWPSVVPISMPDSVLSAARTLKLQFDSPTPSCNPSAINRMRSCNETSGISPSTYKTVLRAGADHRRREDPVDTAKAIESPSQL